MLSMLLMENQLISFVLATVHAVIKIETSLQYFTSSDH